MSITFATMPLSECNQFVGHRIRVKRAEQRLTQQELADRIGMNRSKISKLENNEHQFTLVGLVQIARAFGCSVSDLVSDDTHPQEAAA